MDTNTSFLIDDAIENDDNIQFSSIGELQLHNLSQTNTNINVIGDRIIIGQVIQLLSYIRHALKNNANTQINVNIANTVANPTFNFDVNGLQIPDLVTQTTAQIN